ncbi:MAG: MBL fold metallo-hydrolase [Sneathiella sp.]|nr:MBL fold metallo-hydrolase [Sneathiella sp.]
MVTLNAPEMFDSQAITKDWKMLSSWMPVPELGVLPVNSFLLKAREALLVDTGLGILGVDFLKRLEGEIDLPDLKWIWLSHMDADHVGNLQALLDAAPNARVLTNFLGMGKLNLAGFDVSRVTLIDQTGVPEIAGHNLIPVRPPYYDAPETMGFFDRNDGVFFAGDSFGALLPGVAHDLAGIAKSDLQEGLALWSSIDAPWLASVSREAFDRTLAAIDRLDPAVMISSHLPIVRNGISDMTAALSNAYRSGPVGGFDPFSVDHVINSLAA